MHPGQTCTHSGPQAPGGGQEHRIAGDSGGEEVEHANRVSPVKAGRLRHVADQRPGLVAPCPLELNGSGVRHLSQDGTEKRALSRPVGADKGHDLPQCRWKETSLNTSSPPKPPRSVAFRQQVPAQPGPVVPCLCTLIPMPPRWCRYFSAWRRGLMPGADAPAHDHVQLVHRTPSPREMARGWLQSHCAR